MSFSLSDRRYFAPTVLFLPTMGWGGGEQTGPLSPSFTDPLLQTMVFQIICKSPLLQWPPRFVYPQHFCLRFSIFFIYWQIFPSPLLCNIRPLFLRSSLPGIVCPFAALDPLSFLSHFILFLWIWPTHPRCWMFLIFSNLKISWCLVWTLQIIEQLASWESLTHF